MHPLELVEDHPSKEDGGERVSLEPELHGGHVGAPLKCLYTGISSPAGPSQFLSLLFAC